MKRAELAINVVIIAVIAILVLVVLAVLLMKGVGKGGDTALSCENAGGQCVPANDKGGCDDVGGVNSYHYIIGDSGCSKATRGEICCKTQE